MYTSGCQLHDNKSNKLLTHIGEIKTHTVWVKTKQNKVHFTLVIGCKAKIDLGQARQL